jgi:hypothetical protein
VNRALTRFGFYEIDPPIKFSVQQTAMVTGLGGVFQIDVKIERGAPGSLLLERAEALGTPFVTVTNSPQFFLGNKLFRFIDSEDGAAIRFYRVRALP